MIRSKNKMTIDVPRKRVYDFLTRFENIPLWNYYVLSVNRKFAEDEDKDTVYHQVRKGDEQDFRVLEMKPEEKVRIETTPESVLQFTRTFTLSGNGDETKLDDDFEVETRSPVLFEKIVQNRVRKAVRGNLYKLKELLERGETVLQDGRKINLQIQ